MNRHGQAYGDDEPSPFFIVGVGRSGTTLLMAMLNAHPDLTLPPETHLLRRYAAAHVPKSIEDAQQRLQADPYVARLSLNLDAISDLLQTEKQPLSWANVYRLLLRLYRRRANAAIIGDKDPKSVEYLPVLHCLFPEAKVIHVVRDPRDVYVSRLKAEWSQGRSRFSHMLAYRAQFRLGRTTGRSLFNDRYKEVRYEQLLEAPERELRKIADFLGVEYRAEMLDFSESAKSIVAADEASWKQNVAGPILSGNTEKWRSELTPTEVIQIEAACDGVFEEGLYERSGWSHAWHQRAQGVAMAALVKAAERVYTLRANHTAQRATRTLMRTGC